MLEPILQKFNLTCSPQQLELAREYRGFSGAVVTRIETDEGLFAIRQWPAGSLQRERLHGLHRLLRFLNDSGVNNIAVPRIAGRSSTLCKQQGTFWQCEPWLRGEADLLEKQSENRIQATMFALAQWHLSASQFKPAPSEKPWFYQQESGTVPAITERISLIESWNPQRVNNVLAVLNRSSEPWAKWSRNYLDLFSQVSSRLLSQLNMAQSVQVPLQPCLRDLWHEHVLLEGDEVTGLIDPSACRTENVTIDLARLLGSLFGDDKLKWDQALNYYQQKRPLSHHEIFLVELLDQSSVLLSGFSWIERFLSGAISWDQDERIPVRLDILLNRLKQLSRRKST